MNLKLILIFLIFMSCNSEKKKTIIGIYNSKNETFFDKIFGKYDYWGIGSTLILEKDSTFFMKNCGNILEGTWEVKNDSLNLLINSNRFVIDSLNEIQELREQLEFDINKSSSFKVKKFLLYKKILTIESNGDKKSIVLKLKKQ